MPYPRNYLVLLEKTIERARAAGIGDVPQHLERDPLAGIFGLGEIHGRELARIELAEQTTLTRAVHGLVIDEQTAGILAWASGPHLGANRIDKSMMAYFVFWKVAGRS